MGALFVIIIGVLLFTRLMALSGLAQRMADYVIELGLDRITFLLVLVVIYVILGMFFDSLSMILLTMPVLIAPLEALDISLLWFGIFLVILCEVGAVTPPIGVLTFVVHKIAETSIRDMGIKVSLSDVFKGVAPFVAAALLFLLFLIFFPDVVTWLPSQSSAL